MDLLVKIWHLLPFQIRLKFSKLANYIRDSIITNRLKVKNENRKVTNKKVTLVGIFRSALSHNNATRLLLLELEKSNFEVSCIDISEIVNAPISNDEKTPTHFKIDSSVVIFAINPENMAIVIDRLDKGTFENKKKIGFWVWELEEPPKSWKKYGKLVHEIWTPSKFSANALRKIYDKPIYVVPHAAAVDTRLINQKKDARKLRDYFGVSQKSFVVIQSFAFSSSLERKNAINSIRAFAKAFNGQENVTLIIRHLFASHYQDAYYRLKSEAMKVGNNIQLLSSNGTLEELHDLYAIADVYISLHRSEGFGLNIAEAMLAGIPVIATNWSGNIDFMNDKCAAMVDYELIKVKDPDKIYKLNYLYWAEPNIETAAKHLKELYHNKNLRETLSIKGRNNAINYLSGGAAANVLSKHINNIENN